MSYQQQLESNHTEAKPWPQDWRLYVGANTVFPVSIIGALAVGMTLVAEVSSSESADTSLLSKEFTHEDTQFVFDIDDSAAIAGLKDAYMRWDVKIGSDKYRVREGRVPVSRWGTDLPIVPSTAQLSDLRQAVDDYNEIDQNQLDDISTVSGIDGAVVAVANNEANINAIVADLAAIQLVAPTLSMTNSVLTLTLDNNTEVEGSNYNELKDAWDYALTVTQAGGHLKLIIPAATTITESQLTEIDTNRLSVEIEGDNSSDSILELGSIAGANGIVVTGNGGITFSNVKIQSTAGHSEMILFERGSQFHFDDVHIDNDHATGTALRFNSCSHVSIANSSVDAFAIMVYLDAVFDARITDTEVTLTETGDNFVANYGVHGTNHSRVYIDQLTISRPSGPGGGSGIGLSMTDGSKAISKGVLQGPGGFWPTVLSPIADFTNSQDARIITQ